MAIFCSFELFVTMLASAVAPEVVDVCLEVAFELPNSSKIISSPPVCRSKSFSSFLSNVLFFEFYYIIIIFLSYEKGFVKLINFFYDKMTQYKT